MTRLRVYVDTSVLGGVLDREPVGRAEIAGSFMESVRQGKLNMVISGLVFEEIEQAPEKKRKVILDLIKTLPLEEILEESRESTDLTLSYLLEKALPPQAINDARHLAIATSHGLGIVVSWNFRHMANLRVILAVNAVNMRLGYRSLEIVPPEEVLDYGDMGV